MKQLGFLICVAVVVSPCVDAVEPARDLFLPSVGRGQGSCPGGVCSLWRTDVWVLNPDASATASVDILFLRRGQANPDPTSVTVAVGPGQTLELTDIMLTSFASDGVFGALRFVADRDVVVTGRIYDSNVQTNAGTGTAGQFFAALPAHLALSAGQSTDLIGLARDSAGNWRTNFGFVETTGQPASITVELLDGGGASLASASYDFSAFATGQVSIADVGGPPGENQRLRATLSTGPGRLLTFASRIDNRTGDPSTVEMVTTQQSRLTGTFEGVVMSTDGLRIDGGIELALSSPGLTEFAGVTGIPCGEQIFTVDFGTPPIPPVAVASDGSFAATVTIPYTDAGVPVFTIEWTLSGTVRDSGVITGALSSLTSEGLGPWSDCDGPSERSWRAGWVEP